MPALCGNYLDIVQGRGGGVYQASRGGWQIADAVVLPASTHQHPLCVCACVCVCTLTEFY